MSARRNGFVVSDAEAGERLDRLVARHVPGVGRRRARALFEAGAVTMNARSARAAAPAIAGSRVEVELADEAPHPEPELPLDVRYEHAAVVVAHKPAGQPTAPLAPGEHGTLANALVARYPELAGIGHRLREPGLIHRLDTQTSGLVIAARSAEAFGTLARALAAGRIAKRYLAVTPARGLPERGVIEAPLGPDPGRKGRVRVVPEPTREYAREATTHFRVLEVTSRYTLLELAASRAFRHQIRVHLASMGAPLVGDTLYGGPPWPSGGPRHALHASYAAWAGDRTVPSFEVNAALPDDMRRLLEP